MNLDDDNSSRTCAAALALRRMVPSAPSRSPVFVSLSVWGEVLSNAPSPSLCIESWMEGEEDSRRHKQLAATGIVRASPRNALLAVAEAHARQRLPLFVCCREINEATLARSSDTAFSAVAAGTPMHSSCADGGQTLRWFRSPLSNRLQPWIPPIPPAPGVRVPQTVAAPLPLNLSDDVAAQRHSTLRLLERLLNKLLSAYTLAHRDRGGPLGGFDPPTQQSANEATGDSCGSTPAAASAFVRMESTMPSALDTVGREAAVVVDVFSVWKRFDVRDGAEEPIAADKLPREVWKSAAGRRPRSSRRQSRGSLFEWTADDDGKCSGTQHGDKGPQHQPQKPSETEQEDQSGAECVFRHRMELRLNLDLRKGTRSMDVRHHCGAQIRSGSRRRHIGTAFNSLNDGASAMQVSTSFVATERRAEMVPLMFLDRASVRAQQHRSSQQHGSQQQSTATAAAEAPVSTFHDGSSSFYPGRLDVSGAAAATSDAVGSMPVLAVALHLLGEMQSMELHMVQLFEDVAVPRLLATCCPLPRVSLLSSSRRGVPDTERGEESESTMRKEVLDYALMAAVRRETDKPPGTSAGASVAGMKTATVFASVW